jgi:hypothetical protein
MLLERAAARIPAGRLFLEGSTAGLPAKKPGSASLPADLKPAA